MRHIAWIMVALVGCTQLKEQGKAALGDAIDCTTAHARTLTDEFAPLVDELLRHATGADGKIDWSPVKEATKRFAIDTGGCVVASVVARALAPKPADPNAPQVAGLEIDRADLLVGFRALYPGKRFKTDHGEL